MSESTDSTNQKRQTAHESDETADSSQAILPVAIPKPALTVLEDKTEKLSNAFTQILTLVGENPDRDGLVKTPDRAATAFLHFTKGYSQVLKGKKTLFTDLGSLK
jgi:hypothetical protein